MVAHSEYNEFGRGNDMITIRVSTDVKDDRRVVLTLPPEVPLGKTELIISIAPDEPQGPRVRRSSLADWAEERASLNRAPPQAEGAGRW